jgi:hypothetical protein
MSLQTLVTLTLALGAAYYLGKDALKGLFAKGCASGCGGCSKTCTLKSLSGNPNGPGIPPARRSPAGL